MSFHNQNPPPLLIIGNSCPSPFNYPFLERPLLIRFVVVSQRLELREVLFLLLFLFLQHVNFLGLTLETCFFCTSTLPVFLPMVDPLSSWVSLWFLTILFFFSTHQHLIGPLLFDRDANLFPSLSCSFSSFFFFFWWSS